MTNEIIETNPAAPFLAAMARRGSIHQCTDVEGLDRLLSSGTATAYVGFDATADSLHVGHLVSLMSMRRLAEAGHRVIALVGGATTLVGDPSFRNATRPMLTKEQVTSNIVGIRANIDAVMGDHADGLKVVDNSEWLGEVGMIDFMRSVGTHFTVARMMSMDSVKGRLETGQSMSMLEFTYMLLQAADFLELSRREGCLLQMGGSDQWGNIVNGIELARRADGRGLFGLTTPLLANANGEKMGKTANGAVWLSPDKLHPSDFWQFWRDVDDADVLRFLLLFTDIPVDEAERVAAGEGSELNDAKRLLANSVTEIVHGSAAALDAERKADALFGAGPLQATHTLEVSSGSIGLIDLMVEVGFAETKGEARRLVRGGAVKLDDDAVTDETISIDVQRGPLRISVGKKRRAVVEFTGHEAAMKV